MANTLTVYVSAPPVPLCERVCTFLDSRGYSYERIDVATEADREAMRERTGYASCPLVVAGDEIIGKLDQTIEADRTGLLAQLLQA